MRFARITEYYSELANTPASDRQSWSHDDWVIWFVISTRCEIDMNGFESVFEQFLSSTDLDFLITALQQLDEVPLADAFHEAGLLLAKSKFYERELFCSDLAPDVRAELERIESVICADDRLWDLDGKLSDLLPST